MSLEDRVSELEERLDYLTELLGQFAGNVSVSNNVSTGSSKGRSVVSSRPNIKRSPSSNNIKESHRSEPVSLAALAGSLLDDVGMEIKQF